MSEGAHLTNAFRRVRDLDVSLREQLRTFAETARRERPEFAAAVDRLVTRLRQYGAGEGAPKIGDSMPSFVLPDASAQMDLKAVLDVEPELLGQAAGWQNRRAF